MARTFLAVVFLMSFSVAVQAQVVVEVVQGPPTTGQQVHIQQPDVDLQRGIAIEQVALTPPPPEVPEGTTRTRPSRRQLATLGFFGTGLDFGDRAWRFGAVGIEALANAELPVFDPHARAGGFTFGTGLLLGDWLRLPEIRLSFGGGDLDGPFTDIEAEQDGLQARVVRHFMLRFEVLAGLEHEFGMITPFARAFAHATGHFGAAEIRNAELGSLGNQRIRQGSVGLGLELGLAVRISKPRVREPASFFVAYRRGLVGTEAHGVTIGIAIVGAP